MVSQRALNDFRFQYAFAKYEVSPPYSHGVGASRLRGDRLPLCTPVFNYPTSRSAAAATPDGTRRPLELKDDFSYLMRAFGGTHQWKMGFDFSHIPFEGDNRNAAWQLDVPEGRPVRRQRSHDVAHAVHQHAADLRQHPGEALAAYLQDDWQAAAG